MFFWWIMENHWANTYSLVFQVSISFTWVAEKSTHCKNGQFSPNACKDTSVIPKQPPKSMIFSSRQLSARARTPSSVRLQHLFKEASCRYEQEEATAFIPEGKQLCINELYTYIHEKCDFHFSNHRYWYIQLYVSLLRSSPSLRIYLLSSDAVIIKTFLEYFRNSLHML